MNKSDEHVEIKTGTGRNIIINPVFDSPHLRKVVNDPEKYLETGRILKDSRSVKAGIVCPDGCPPLFIKRYNNKGFTYSLKYAFRQDKASRSFRSALSYMGTGVEFPLPIAAICEKRMGVPVKSFLILESVENVVPTLDFFRISEVNPLIKNDYIAKIAELLSNIHGSGIMHGDSKLSNFYVSSENPDSGVFSIGIWDFDATTIFSTGLPNSKRIKELARTASSFCEISLRLGFCADTGEIAGKLLEKYEAIHKSGINLKEFRLKTDNLFSAKMKNGDDLDK